MLFNQYLLIDFQKKVKGSQCKPLFLYDYETWICCILSELSPASATYTLNKEPEPIIPGSQEAVILPTSKEYSSPFSV